MINSRSSQVVGQMLVRFQMTEDLMEKWQSSSHAREVVPALVAARAAKPSQTCRYGCFEILRCVIGRLVVDSETQCWIHVTEITFRMK